MERLKIIEDGFILGAKETGLRCQRKTKKLPLFMPNEKITKRFCGYFSAKSLSMATQKDLFLNMGRNAAFFHLSLAVQWQMANRLTAKMQTFLSIKLHSQKVLKWLKRFV